MPGRGPGPGSAWAECGASSEAGEGGGGSVGHSYCQKSKGIDRIKEGHKVNSHIVKLQELWKTPQIHTIYIPKTLLDASFLKRRDVQRHLCGLARLYHANSLRTLMKQQYARGVQRRAQARSRLSSPGSPRQCYPCASRRHPLQRGDSSHPEPAPAPVTTLQRPLWRPVRNKEGLKTGYASKIRCKSLKIFRRPGRLFMQPVYSNDSELYMNEEKEEDLLNTCMQSLSIEEQGECLMST